MLTFVTVLMGSLAVVAGVFGMNFQTAFFDLGAKGFWIAIAGMLVIAALATILARWRHWF